MPETTTSAPGVTDQATAAPGPVRPLPAADEPDTRPLWEGSREQELRYPVCDACHRLIWYPRAHCPSCGSLSVTWVAAATPVEGAIYTFTVVRRHLHPFFATRVPYVVAWIDLDAGPRLLSEVTDADPDAVRIGDRVRLHWERHESLSLPLFAPLT
jgi:uncharacterized OB-fold protein